MIIVVSVMLRGQRESPLEGTNETGVVPISHSIRNLLDGKVCHREKLRGLLKPSFRDQAAKLNTCLLFEQSLEVCRTE